MELNSSDMPSMNNVYQSNYWNKVKANELKLSNDMYMKSKDPYKTGVVPLPANLTMNNYNDNKGIAEDDYSLTGNKKSKNLKHNNMQPFLKGNVTQNTDVDKFTSRLDINTGNDKYYMQKKEVSNFFKPVSGFSDINGMKERTDFYKNRLEVSKINNNVFPIDQVKVGPGLNKGYSSEGSGGFHSGNTIDFAKPKSINELRSKINNKDSYFEVRQRAPPKGTEQRGIVSSYVKNKPETTFEQSEDQWIRTTGTILKENARPEQIIKLTNKHELHNEYKGTVKSEYIKGFGLSEDYGKKNIIISSNERDLTQTKTVQTNITSIVKALIAPVMDVFKHTIKEYTIDNFRENGNLKTQIPEKATLYDPVNHIMKTTIKETTLQESKLINLAGHDESYMGNQDIAKTTVKETTLQESEFINLAGHDESYMGNQDIAKTTMKETLIHEPDTINLTGNKASYEAIRDTPKTTIKETLPVQDTTRNIGSVVYKTYVYDPDLIVKTTLKETVIKGKSDNGFISSINSIFGGYLSKEIDLKNTNKQFTSDYTEYGIAGSSHSKDRSREAENNAVIDGFREDLLIKAGHTPNPGRVNINNDKNTVNFTSNKLKEDSYCERISGNIGKIYQNAPSIDEYVVSKDIKSDNAYENRLDAINLQPSIKNDLSIRINPL
jgi:hypothetical protein